MINVPHCQEVLDTYSHTTTGSIARKMSLSIPQASQAGLFKPGYNSYDAEDGAVIRNVNVPRTISGDFH